MFNTFENNKNENNVSFIFENLSDEIVSSPNFNSSSFSSPSYSSLFSLLSSSSLMSSGSGSGSGSGSSCTTHPMMMNDKDCVLQLFEQEEEEETSFLNMNNVQTSSSSSSSSFEEEEKSDKLHPISCVRCRAMHKFCSRHKTGCERCNSKGVECQYRESKRVRAASRDKKNSEEKKRKLSSLSETESETESTMEELFIPPNPTLCNNFPKHFSKPLAINSYYWMICDIYVIVEKKEMEKYILHNFGTDTVSKKEMEAFFYSAKALVEQFVGQCESAEVSCQKSKKKIALLINEEPSHLIASTYYNLALYETGTGRTKMSNYYLHCAKFNYMNKSELELSNMNQYERMLFKSIGFLENLAIEEVDVTKMTRNFPKLFEYSSGQSLPESVSSSMQQEVTPDNCFHFIKVGEEISNYIVNSALERASQHKSESQMRTYSKALHFLKNLFLNGVRAGVLIKAVCRRDIIEESCLKITYLTQNEFFGVASVFMIPFFCLAARVHIQIVKSIENGTRRNMELGNIGQEETKFHPIDYYKIIEMDYRALNVLGKRFKRIHVHNSKLLSTLAHILHERNINQCKNVKATAITTTTTTTTTTPQEFLVEDTNEAI